MARREGIVLDLRGLNKLENLFGREIKFNVGFFNKEQVKKIYNLEFGVPKKQVERPVMSKMYDKGCPTYNKVMLLVKDLVNQALKGNDISVATAKKITVVVQNHFLDQLFDVPELKKSTIKRKQREGATAPDKVGLDTFEMVDSIKTRIEGGKKDR